MTLIVPVEAKRTSTFHNIRFTFSTSAPEGEADIASARVHVCNAPEADVARAALGNEIWCRLSFAFHVQAKSVRQIDDCEYSENCGPRYPQVEA
jgi:hypothetical protein